MKQSQLSYPTLAMAQQSCPQRRWKRLTTDPQPQPPVPIRWETVSWCCTSAATVEFDHAATSSTTTSGVDAAD